MVANDLAITSVYLPETLTEAGYNVSGTLATFQHMEITLKNIIAADPILDVLAPEFVNRVQTSGVGPSNDRQVAYRYVLLPTSPSSNPTVITSFFTTVLNDATAFLDVVPIRDMGNGTFLYAVFYHTQTGAGAVNYTLTVESFIDDDDNTALSVTTAAPAYTKTVRRSDQGNFTSYDVFMLEVQ